MKLTDDIIKALQGCVEGFGSISLFADRANVNKETLGKYLSRATTSVSDEIWEKIYPYLKHYLPKGEENSHRPPPLTSDQKILLDAFTELPEDVKQQKLREIVELAKTALQKKHNSGGNAIF
jgi:hypothetical protein